MNENVLEMESFLLSSLNKAKHKRSSSQNHLTIILSKILLLLLIWVIFDDCEKVHCTIILQFLKHTCECIRYREWEWESNEISKMSRIFMSKKKCNIERSVFARELWLLAYRWIFIAFSLLNNSWVWERAWSWEWC